MVAVRRVRGQKLRASRER